MENKMTVSIKHNLTFVTDLDETHPTAILLLSLSTDEQVLFLEGMLQAVVAPRIQPILDEVNEGSSFALLKVAE
jgi:hypothetical protein